MMPIAEASLERCRCDHSEPCDEPIYREGVCYWCWQGLDAEYHNGPFRIMAKAARILKRSLREDAKQE